jgi:hypothetical protein
MTFQADHVTTSRSPTRERHPKWQPEQDVLGADVVMAQRPRLFLSQDDHLARALSKSLKHTAKVPTLGR